MAGSARKDSPFSFIHTAIITTDIAYRKKSIVGMETPSANNGLANSGFIPYETPAAIPAAIPIAMLLSLFIAGAKIRWFLPKCPTSTPLTTLVERIGVGHTLCMRVCNTTRGAMRLTGPMGVGHFGGFGKFP